jgi:tetratricopeptide (TPR) repeat protein
MRVFPTLRLLAVSIVLLAAAANGSTEQRLQEAEVLIEKERFPEAEALLVKAAAETPDNAQVLYRLGYARYRQRKLAAARQNFAAVVKLAPPALSSRYFLGRIALLENRHKEAIEWLAPVAESPEPVFDAASQLAKAYAATGQDEKAITALQAALSQAPWDDTLYYRIGQLRQKLGQRELAAEDFAASRRLKNLNREDVATLMQVSQALASARADEAVRLGAAISGRAEANPDTLVALGVLYGKANLTKEALACFEIAAQRDGSLFQPQLNRGLALLKLGRPQDALPPLERAAALLPQSREANVTLGLAQAMVQNYGAAIEPLERAWQAEPLNARVGLLLATAYLRTGEPAKALPILAAIPAAEPASFFLGIEARNATRDEQGALALAEQAAARFPSLPQAHLALAQQLARVGRYQDARPSFEAVLRLVPGQPEAELGVADSLQKAGDHAAAADHYRAALAGPSTNLAATLGLARSLAALRRLEEAAGLLEEAIARYPNEATVRLELSRVYARAGNSALAAEQARMAERIRAAQPQ